jgi:DamX protein
MSNLNLPAQQRDYLQTYSLKSEPFSNTLDGRFFYAGTALMQRLDLLIHLTQFGDAVVLVSGPDGSGKTTLLSRFAAQANRQWRLCPVNADEFEQFTDLMAKTLQTGEIQDELQMFQHWASETDNSQLLVILVDKAEALSQAAVDRLLRLLLCPLRERLRLILFGTPEAQQKLKNTLDSNNLPGSSQLLEVPRLSEEETAAYLMYRLAVAGYSGESPFTATEIRGICKAADGRPGAINLLAHDTLIEQQVRKHSKRVSAAHGKRKPGTAAWVPMTLVIVALATYLGWQRLQPTPEPEALPAEPASIAEQIPLAIPEPAPTSEPVESPAVLATATPDNAEPASQTTQGTTTHAVPEAVAQAITESIDTHAPAGTAGINTVDATAAAVAEATTNSEKKIIEPLAAPATVVASETTAKLPAKAPALTTDNATAEPAAQIAEKKPEATKTKVVAEPGDQGPHREAWLLAQQGALYSLQLLGSRSEESVVDYINRYRLDPSLSAYYRGDYRGSDWYVLLYGIYPDRQAALEARAGLPAAVRKAKPWPRDLASVHKAITAMKP